MAMNNKILLFLFLAAATTAAFSFTSASSSFVVTFSDSSLEQHTGVSIVDRVKALVGHQDCIVDHARSWTLHVFCPGDESNDAMIRRRLSAAAADPTLHVEALHHRSKFDYHAAQVLDGSQADREPCRDCCVVVRALAQQQQQQQHPEGVLQSLPRGAGVQWKVHDDIGGHVGVKLAVACSLNDHQTRQLLSSLVDENGNQSASAAAAAAAAVIMSVSVVHPSTPANFYSRGVLSTGNPGADFFQSVGVLGKGSVVGVADTGLDFDHCFFDDPDTVFHYDSPMPGHRKIARYKRLVAATDPESGKDEVPGHGTHVVGTVVGSPLNNPALFSLNVSRHHGFAPMARVSFVDIAGSGGIVNTNPISLIFDDPRFDGAAVHSDSWGSAAGAALYTEQARQVDQYVQAFEGFLPVFAAGNDADKGCMDRKTNKLLEGDVICDHYSAVSPGTCKNGLSVGSSVAPLASWQEADYGNFVLEVRLGEASSSSSKNTGELDHGGPGVLATFNAVHAQFGAHHPRLAPTHIHLVEPSTACADDIRDIEKLAGAIAVVTRGTCIFTEKAERVQRAGAAMLLVVNNEAGSAIQMGAAGAHTTVPITIPVVMISKEAGAKLKQLASLYSEARLRCALHETSLRLETKNRHDISGFSGRGPTRDLRYKPDIMAIGEFVHSAASDGKTDSHNCGLWASMGTSMATPQIAASAALAREYFQRKLHVPEAQRQAAPAQDPSAAGMKALLILAAVPLSGVVDRNLHGDVRHLAADLSPSFEQGHGILRLASVLPNYEQKKSLSAAPEDEDPRYSLAARQNGVALLESRLSLNRPIKHGEVVSFCFEYKNASAMPFRAALAWTDPAANSVQSEAQPVLIHDLDLVVDDSAGRRYRGNKHGPNPPEEGDDRNNVEKVHATTTAAAAPAAQFFLVSVHGKRVPSGDQHFALAVSSGHQLPLSSCILLPAHEERSTRTEQRRNHTIGCAADADCSASSSSSSSNKCVGGVCLCSRGFRGSRCQLAPLVLPPSVVDQRVYPMQVQEYAFLLSRSFDEKKQQQHEAAAEEETIPSLRVSLRSMQRDGDPNLVGRWDVSSGASSVAVSLAECDDCTPAPSADTPRDVRIATVAPVPLPSSDRGDQATLFLSVTAACCWWARYQLGVEPSLASLRTAPALVTAAHVHRLQQEEKGQVSKHFFEFLLQVHGDHPLSARLLSRDGVGEEAVIPSASAVAQHDAWCNSAIKECTLQFPADTVQALLCPTSPAVATTTAAVRTLFKKTMLSLELTYSHGRVVLADLVEGADSALNCTRLHALPIVELPHHSHRPPPHSTTAAAPGAPTPAPPITPSPSHHTTTAAPVVAMFVTKISAECENNLRDDYAVAGAWTVPEAPVLRPAPRCFTANQQRQSPWDPSSLARWLILPNSISDFPIRVAVRVNLTLLNETRHIGSTRFLQVSFRSKATAVSHPCTSTTTTSNQHHTTTVGDDDGVIVCDLGGDGAQRFIRPQTPLMLQLTDPYAPNGAQGTILLEDVGVVVSPGPQTAGFVSTFEPAATIVQTDFALPPWRTHVQLAAVGAYLSPTSWEDAFGLYENGPESIPAGVDGGRSAAPAPQVAVALRLARLSLVPADDTEQFSLGNFGSLLCDPLQPTSVANVSRTRLSCAVPRRPVQCGVPLTLHLSVDRVLFGSSAELIPNSVMFPAVECGLTVLGIEGPGRAVLGIAAPESAGDVAFNIVGQFSTVRHAAVSMTLVPAKPGVDEVLLGVESEKKTTAAAAAAASPPPAPPVCTVRSRSSTVMRVSCALREEHMPSKQQPRPVVFHLAIHGTDISSSSTALEFTVWKTARTRQELTLIVLSSGMAPSSSSSSSSSSAILSAASVVGGVDGGVATVLKLGVKMNDFAPQQSAVVGAVSRRPLFLHVRLGAHHSCEVLNASELIIAGGGGGNNKEEKEGSIYCVAPSVALSFTAGGGSSSSSSSPSSLSSASSLDARLELWAMGQDLPVFDFGTVALPQDLPELDFLTNPSSRSSATAGNSSSSATTTVIRFAARPASALLAALSQHHTRRFEVASSVFFAGGRSPEYFELQEDGTAASSSSSSNVLSLFAVTGAAAHQNPCRGATKNELVRSTLSDLHAVRLRRRMMGKSSSDVVYPARFDAVSYPCPSSSSSSSSEDENWLTRRAFFVAVCSTLGRKQQQSGDSSSWINIPPIQIAEMRPPRFVALHASSSTQVSDGLISEQDEDEGGNEDDARVASHMRHDVVQLVLPGCDNHTATHQQPPEQEQKFLSVDRGVTLVLGVTVNIALYAEEVRRVQRNDSHPLVRVDHIFFSLEPDCGAPLTATRLAKKNQKQQQQQQQRVTSLLSVRMNPQLTTLHVHDEHWWSRTTASYTFSAADTLHTSDFEAAAFPARSIFVCATWSGETDALVFSQHRGASSQQDGGGNDDEEEQQQQQEERRRRTNHTARIATARLGACTRDSDCDGESSFCEHRQCRCSKDRRGAWCEKQCPSGAADGRLCSGHGSCNAVAVCECDKFYTGTSCSEELHVASDSALSKKEKSSGQARGKLSAWMVIDKKQLSSPVGSKLHLALDTLPAGRQVRVVMSSSSGFFSGPVFEQHKKLEDGTSVTLRRTPAVLFWTDPLQLSSNSSSSSVAAPAESTPVVVVASQDSSKKKESSSFVARSPTFTLQGREVSSPFRALTVFLPGAPDLFDKESLTQSVTTTGAPPSSSDSSSDGEVSIQLEIFMDADAPAEGGCETSICALFAICAGIGGAAFGFTTVFIGSKWWSDRKKRLKAEQGDSGATTRVIVENE